MKYLLLTCAFAAFAGSANADTKVRRDCELIKVKNSNAFYWSNANCSQGSVIAKAKKPAAVKVGKDTAEPESDEKQGEDTAVVLDDEDVEDEVIEDEVIEELVEDEVIEDEVVEDEVVEDEVVEDKVVEDEVKGPITIKPVKPVKEDKDEKDDKDDNGHGNDEGGVDPSNPGKKPAK